MKASRAAAQKIKQINETAPQEALNLFLREVKPGEVQLVIGGGSPTIYRVREGQLTQLAIDATAFRLRRHTSLG